MLEFDKADRMRKALRVADVSNAEMAEYLGMSTASVGAWINGRKAPKRMTLRLWAIRTGVPLEWLETGNAPESDDGPEGGVVHPLGLEPRTH
ncbi:XRE family transcriptional regulator [Rathayibacter sp. AY1A7]|nr:XRE family transcriptional regulator [Rathayibacter sp. AY1A7]